MLKQISVYTENKKGTMRKLLTSLSEAGINVLGFVNNDSAEFGTVRIIADDSEKALSALGKAGYLCRESSVLGAELDDRPGALGELLSVYDEMNVNLDYIYVGYSRESSKPIILLHSDDMTVMAQTLEQRGYTIY